MTTYTEFPAVPFAVTEDPPIDFVQSSGGLIVRDGPMLIGVWTVPPGVRSFSMALRGGSEPFIDIPAPGAYFLNVPCTPGEQWLLEGGDGPYALDAGKACRRNTFHGGDSILDPFESSSVHSGNGASVLWKRGTEDEVFAVMGGRGGLGVAGGAVIVVPADGPISYGGLTSPSGGSNGGDQTTYTTSGAGSGGWPGGAAATAAESPGQDGGGYLPDVSGSTLGPIASPLFDQFFAGGTFPITGGPGQVWIWYFRPPPAVPVVGRIRLS
jgi:hypothetical protein